MASLGSAAARRSIQLNELVLNSGNAYIPRLTTWFQHESFLFDIMQLRSLQVRNVGHARAIPVVPLLQYVGASLKELHLQASQAYRPLEEGMSEISFASRSHSHGYWMFFYVSVASNGFILDTHPTCIT